MKITQESDYALRLAYCLAQKNAKLDAKSISEECAVPTRFSLKILAKLARGGLVRSFKGVNGGYTLAKNPCNISMLDIIETIDGPFEINRCLGDGNDCTRVNDKDSCPFHCVFNSVNTLISNKLSSITLEMILNEGCNVITKF